MKFLAAKVLFAITACFLISDRATHADIVLNVYSYSNGSFTDQGNGVNSVNLNSNGSTFDTAIRPGQNANFPNGAIGINRGGGDRTLIDLASLNGTVVDFAFTGDASSGIVVTTSSAYSYSNGSFADQGNGVNSVNLNSNGSTFDTAIRPGQNANFPNGAIDINRGGGDRTLIDLASLNGTVVDFAFTGDASSGIVVTAVAVPEPSSFLFCALALPLALRRRREHHCSRCNR